MSSLVRGGSYVTQLHSTVTMFTKKAFKRLVL